MEDLSLHMLDIAENAVRAEAKLIRILVVEDAQKDELILQIEDDGTGMDAEALRRAIDPFFTTKDQRRFGLGLALLAQAAREADGEFEISSAPQTGTKVRATFRRSHPDCKPFGDVAATLETLVAGSADVDWVFECRKNGHVTRFDTREA